MSKMNKKGLVPELRFPEFLDQEPWACERFDKLYKLKVTNSLSRDKLNYEKGSVKNIHYGDIHTKFSTLFDIKKESVPFINSSVPLDKINLGSYCQEGDMVFADASEDMDDIGKCIELTNLNSEKLLAGLHTLLARQIDNKIVKGFGGHLFKSAPMRKQIQREAQGAKVLGISGGRITTIDVIYPEDETEQQKISDCLSSLDELVIAQNQKIESLKAYKKGLMQQLFPTQGKTLPKLRFPEFQGAWVKYSIETLVQDKLIFAPKDGNHGNIHPKSTDYVEHGIPFIMANNIKNGEIDLLKCSHLTKEQADNLQKGFAKEEDVLLTHKGTVGRVTVVRRSEFPYLMLTPQVTYYRVRDKEKLLNKFLAFAFISEEYQQELKNVSGGGTRAYVGITAQQKLSIVIPPTFEEQKKVADYLLSVDELIIAQCQKLESFKVHKKGLMQQLFPVVNEESV
ncbi:Restriction endonuclease S subunit [Moritella viscosa]|uniref:restriction endonuclease subunit S n=1 Tax=Moritella viscosa TaxID=80854 RepID=UPI00090FEA91|nr:restriction endonuclease subunit S [Moritella viscosa]SGY99634.1 Restriction endonuclease S subunit [Moritella viscosa]